MGIQAYSTHQQLLTHLHGSSSERFKQPVESVVPRTSGEQIGKRRSDVGCIYLLLMKYPCRSYRNIHASRAKTRYLDLSSGKVIWCSYHSGYGRRAPEDVPNYCSRVTSQGTAPEGKDLHLHHFSSSSCVRRIVA